MQTHTFASSRSWLRSLATVLGLLLLPHVAHAQAWVNWTAGTATSASFNVPGGPSGTVTLALAGCGDPATTLVGAVTSLSPGTPTNYTHAWYTPLPPIPAQWLGIASNTNTCTGNAVTGTLTFTFNAPVTDPIFHFLNLDAAEVRFLDGVSITRLSGNNELEVVGASVNSPPQPAFAGGCEANNGGNPEGGCGSVRANGTFTQVRYEMTDVVPAAGSGDGHAISLSLPAPPPLNACTPDQLRLTQRYWFFGNQAGLDFGPSALGPPQAIVGAGSTPEGSTVVTDTLGQLQFWSNAGIIYNQNNQPMPNGSGLLGDASATQTVASFPAIGRPGFYFVVTTDSSHEPGTLRYSEVDMSLDGGLGDVTSVKNVQLGVAGTAMEGINAIPNATGTGFWVLTATGSHPGPPATTSMNLLAYEFNGNGPVTGNAVITTLPFANSNVYHRFQISPDLSQILFLDTATGASRFYLMAFNAAAGQASPLVTWLLPAAAGHGYGTDFSPSGQYVYATSENGQLYRYDIVANTTQATLQANAQLISSSAAWAQIRRGPDGKMYGARLSATALDVVNAPDAPGAAANVQFQVGGLPLASGTASFDGLPEMVTGCPVVLPADLAITKTDSSATYTPGTNVMYSIVVSNNGPGAIIGATISDPLPTGIATANWTCGGATGGGACGAGSGIGAINTTANLPVGASVTYTLTMAVPATYSGNLVNTATITPPTGITDPNLANNTVQDTDTPAPMADVQMTKVGPATVTAGQTVTYTLMVVNNGPSLADGVSLADPTPAGLSFVSASAPCAAGFPCVLGTLGLGVPVSIAVTYQVPPSYAVPGPIVNTATVTSPAPDPNPTNNTTTTTTQVTAEADLEIVKIGPATVPRAGQAIYTLTVTNAGPSDAAGVTVDDPTPAGLTFVSASAPCASGFPCALGVVPFGGTVTLTVTLAVPGSYSGPASVSNTATVTSPAPDPNPSNNTSTITTEVIEVVDLQVTKTVDNRTPNFNDQVRFTITVLNVGPSTATGVELVDQLPLGLVYVSSSASQGTFDPSTGLWVIGTLVNGASATLQLDVTVTRTGALANVATTTHIDQPDTDLSNNSAGAAVNAPIASDLQANKTVDASTVGVGQVVTFTITIRNAGPDTAPAAMVEDVLPAGMTFVSATPTMGSFDAATGLWAVGSMLNGAEETLVVRATVDIAGTLVNTARASDPNVFDPDPGNNTPGTSVNGESADVQVVKTVDAREVVVGQMVTFTIVVTNNGPSQATGVQVRESLPAGLTYVSSTASQGGYVPETGLWTVGTLTAPTAGGSRATLTVVANVMVGGVVRNLVTIAAQDQPDPSPANNTTFVEVDSGPVDFGAELWYIGDPTRVGAPFDFFLTVTNVGTATATGPVSVMVPFPAEIMFKMQATDWACETVGRLVRCTRDDLVLAPGQSFDVGWWGVVLAPVPAGVTVYAAVTHGSDMTPANDVSAVLVQQPVTTSGDVEVRQTLTLSGSQVVADIDVINHGPDAAAAVTLHDALPTGVTIVSVQPDQGTCEGTTTLMCELGTLPAGVPVRVRLTLAVPAGQPLVHEVSVGSRMFDPVTTNNAAYAVASPALPLDPARDTDGDGMADVWESLMGLDPGVNDAAGDPDGDGLSNAQEAAAGTHPRGFYHQYFAEGVVSPDFFRSTFDVLNADTMREAAVVVNGMLDSGEMMGMPVRLGALGRRSVTADELVHRPSAAFGAMIESDRPFASDRYTTWDPRMYGSALESGLSSTATQWFFAEGATGVFSLFYLLQNPDMTQPVDVTVRYLRAFGEAIVRTYTMAPHSRLTLFVNEVPGLEATEVAADITASRPIVAERAMYLNTPTTLFDAGHVGGGATTSSPTWFFAEGATGAFFDLYLLLANPNPVATTVDVQYQLPDGRVVTKSYPVDAAARRTIYVDEEDPLLVATAVAMSVSATQPIVAERAMWWAPSPGGWYEGHVVLGTTTTGTRWALADGMIGGEWQESFYALIANQAATDGQARVTLVFDDGSQVSRVLALPPTSRTTVQIATEFPEAAGRHFSVVVESVGASPVPLVVEGARYSSTESQFWSAGGAMLGTKLQ